MKFKIRGPGLQFDKWIMPHLRATYYLWPERTKAKQRARQGRGKYQCAACSNLFGPKEGHIDHIIPVIPVTGFDSWDGVMKRLFCLADGLQWLCIPCHKTKTVEENGERWDERRKTKSKVVNYRRFPRAVSTSGRSKVPRRSKKKV